MLLKRNCTVCGKTVGEEQLTKCDTCGRHQHESCAEFERKFECSECSDEHWIGALEF